MSFFTLSDGTELEAINSFENGGIQPIIPEGTQLLCNIVNVEWAEADQRNEEHVVISLYVVQAGQYKNFQVDHKLHVKDLSDKKRDKAIQMLMAYDTNCKSFLQKADKAGKELDDSILKKGLVGGEVVATFAIYPRNDKATGEPMKDESGNIIPGGNWVRAIGPVSKQTQKQNQEIQQKANKVAEEMDFDDDIPF